MHAQQNLHKKVYEDIVLYLTASKCGIEDTPILIGHNDILYIHTLHGGV